MDAKNEIWITSVEEYIKAINENCLKYTVPLKAIDGTEVEISGTLLLKDVWFRGEEKCNDYVLPSLFRKNVEGKIEVGYVESEQVLMTKALQYNTSLFDHCNSFIEKIVAMQHYSLPTRLLDVTKNPLVALFFACQNEDEDGRVLYTTMKLHNYWESPILNSFLELMNEYAESATFTIDNICEVLKPIHPEEFNLNLKMGIIEKTTTSYLFMPRYNNDRIRNQQGALIFSAFLGIDSDSKELYEDIKKEQDSSIVEEKLKKIHLGKKAISLDDQFSRFKFIIPKDAKSDLLKELDNYGVNEAIVFPEPEHQMRYVKWHCINNKY